jgi:peptide/nickel transport system permease protein
VSSALYVPPSTRVTLFRRLRGLNASAQFAVGAALLILVTGLAVFGPLFVPLELLSNAAPDLPPSAGHLMGTGTHSEDVLDQWLYAARYSLSVGLLAGAGSTLLSILIGVTAGYRGGWIDDVLGFIINVFLVVPPFPAILVLAFGLGIVGVFPLVAVLTVMTWAYGASLLRSQTASLRRREFVEASVSIGERPWHVMWYEVIPHLRGLVLFVLVSAVLFALQSEFGLEFLGWGVGAGFNALGGGWGIMLANARYDNDFLAGFWWTWVFPGLGIAVTSAALALMSSGIIALGDPRGRRV